MTTFDIISISLQLRKLSLYIPQPSGYQNAFFIEIYRRFLICSRVNLSLVIPIRQNGSYLSRFQMAWLPDFRPILNPNHWQTNLFSTIQNPDYSGFKIPILTPLNPNFYIFLRLRTLLNPNVYIFLLLRTLLNPNLYIFLLLRTLLNPKREWNLGQGRMADLDDCYRSNHSAGKHFTCLIIFLN